MRVTSALEIAPTKYLLCTYFASRMIEQWIKKDTYLGTGERESTPRQTIIGKIIGTEGRTNWSVMSIDEEYWCWCAGKEGTRMKYKWCCFVMYKSMFINYIGDWTLHIQIKTHNYTDESMEALEARTTKTRSRVRVGHLLRQWWLCRFRRSEDVHAEGRDRLRYVEIGVTDVDSS
jgi:hypothetical protein